MLLYHSVIFPASSRFFEYRGAQKNKKKAHEHHMGKWLFSDFLFPALTKTFCLRKVFMRTLASHWSQMGGKYCFYLSILRLGVLCLRIFLSACGRPLWFRSRLGRQVDQCVVVLGVSDSLAIGWVTWLHLNPLGPLIPKEWFSCSECFNWFFCDLESAFQIRRHTIKDY